MDYAIPKGVYDVLPVEVNDEDKWRESHRWQFLESVLKKAAEQYGYAEIRTPIFERTELFIRSVGESSDIVSKEMYTFLDKAERSMTLRPEGTASVMRAIVEKKLHTRPGCSKFYYMGPMFRYERPQAGRYRQLSQFGIEAMGTSSPLQDAEVIDLACEICQRLGIKDLKVQLNTVGDAATRIDYKEALTEFLRPHFDSLSEESKVRFTKNVLRILDSKSPSDQKIIENAPKIQQFLSDAAKAHFETLLTTLDQLKIPYTINSKLVRGLDYYCHTVFEVTSDELGAQNAVLGGGRFDGLVESLGGPNLPGIGFAMGLERMLQAMLKQGAHFPKAPHPKVLFVPMGQKCTEVAFDMVSKLRHIGIAAEIDLSGKKVQHGLQLANFLNAEFVIVLGDEELASGKIKLKNMATREAQEIHLEEVAKTLGYNH